MLLVFCELGKASSEPLGLRWHVSPRNSVLRISGDAQAMCRSGLSQELRHFDAQNNNGAPAASEMRLM
jgi:hypothetical protein